MALQKGDFILIDYNAKVKETNEVFDTTHEDVAKKEHLYKEGKIYEPKLVVVGEKWILIDENLAEMEVEKPSTVEISPEKGFGQRDPEKIKRVSLKQLLMKDINPQVGAQIEYPQGKDAVVRSVGAGRVLLDYNPPLAGKTLIYDVLVSKKLEGNVEKIGALLHRRIPEIEEKQFIINLQDKNLTIEMPEVAFYIEGVQIRKRGVAMDIQKFFSEIIETKFVETFKSEPKPTPTTSAPTSPTEASSLPAPEAELSPEQETSPNTPQ